MKKMRREIGSNNKHFHNASVFSINREQNDKYNKVHDTVKCGVPRWSQNNRRLRLPHLGMNKVSTRLGY